MAKWFSTLNASGAVAANILAGCVVLIPGTVALMIARGEPIFANLKLTLLMIAGIILADAIGRVFYQKALNATDDDNGFVTMFQNLEPAIAALISFCLSPWRFEAGWGLRSAPALFRWRRATWLRRRVATLAGG
jgi:hypothetical protein